MQSGVRQALGELVKKEIANPGSTDTANVGYTVPGIKVDDIYLIFKNYFTPEAQKVLETKAHHLFHERITTVITEGLGKLLFKLDLKSCSGMEFGYYKRELDMVSYCSSLSDRPNLHKAVEKVINAINDLASRGYITASLVELSVMQLAATNKPEPDYAVMSYVALTDAGQKYVRQQMPKMFVKEGEMPERYENQ